MKGHQADQNALETNPFEKGITGVQKLLVYEKEGKFFVYRNTAAVRINPERLIDPFSFVQRVNEGYLCDGQVVTPPALIRNIFEYGDYEIEEDVWTVVYDLYNENIHEGELDPWNKRRLRN